MEKERNVKTTQTATTTATPSSDVPAVGESSGRTVQFPSTSRPGAFNTVTVDGKKFRCDCSGFGFRRTCSHVKSAAARLARG